MMTRNVLFVRMQWAAVMVMMGHMWRRRRLGMGRWCWLRMMYRVMMRRRWLGVL